MMNRTFSTMMASAAVLGSLMVGCSAGQDHPKLATGVEQAGAPKVERMLADKDYANALAAAEQLVATQPQDAAARAMLGRAYLANGRYISARMAFNDALTLGNRDARTIISLALCEAGLGDPGAARALLSDHIADLPAGDYGLAMAMAGDPQEGIRALLEAVHAPDATVKTRQNLAYALAMAGVWGQARLVAGQDLPAKEAEARIGEWTRTLSQGTPSSRVVAMLGIAPRGDDSGLPAQLALNATPETKAEPVQLASAGDLIKDASERADPAPVAAAVAQAAVPAPEAAAPTAPISLPEPMAKPAFAPEALAAVLAKPVTVPQTAAPVYPVELPEPAKPSAEAAPAAMPSFQKQEAPTAAVLKAAFSPAPAPAPFAAVAKPTAAAPTKDTLKAAFAHPATPKVTDGKSKFISRIGSPVADGKASPWVVQLGAFDSDALARTEWAKLSQRRAALKDYQAVHSTVALNGRTFYRLAIRGFDGRGSAVGTCHTLKAAGQACFVRLDDKASKAG